MKLPEEKFLGKPTPIPQKYAPEVLVAVPRRLNREIYGLRDDALPFSGVDVWHGYEAGFLTRQGLPVTGLIKIIYPADSEFLIESKSLKLYLNSFNMEHLKGNRNEAVLRYVETLTRDLQELVKTPVEVHFFDNQASIAPFDFADFTVLEEAPGVDEMIFSEYAENPELLGSSAKHEKRLRCGSHLLRSNCKITHQPDWGSVFIHLAGESGPTPQSLLKYLVSMRNQDHFHEEICELIYKRLWDKYRPRELMVACLYTRRGGLDICPVRASHNQLLPPALTHPARLCELTLRQ